MFKKILIANRGEIACRVIKTARKMGIKTVAVFSDADRSALHVEMADETYALQGATAAESYLVIEKIIAACKETGAEAVHPGYGFLSENATFAKALADAKIAFIGPNIKAIQVMGDKIESKKFAKKAGVNTVPGHVGVIKNAEEAVKIADEIGYPVMIKASAGGGGKGMRIAHARDEVAEGFATSQSEAKSSFGDDRIFVEKFVEEPRHIEIQILADKHGNVIYLNERECSIQRRNQKVLEEAPSPFLDEATRKAMGEQSVALAEAVKYESAGTVEFIVDKERNFYFLEMNTRLQVEHPVTELITGVDLVEQMIRVAAGDKLELSQGDVKIDGWSVEARIYAEDPFRNFLPSTGRLTWFHAPEEKSENGITTRIDTGVGEGGEISIYYDPMIAKLITHASDRTTAIEAMANALDSYYIDGIQHNIPFLSAIMQHPRWKSGDLSTGFIAEEYPDGFEPIVAQGETADILAAIVISMDQVNNLRRREISQQMQGQDVKFAETRMVILDGEKVRASVTYEGGSTFFVKLLEGGEGETDEYIVKSAWWPGQPVWSGEVNGARAAVQVRPILNGFDLSYRGVRAPAYVYTEREAALVALMPYKEPPDTSKLLLCPMPGLIVSIAVEEGNDVKAGQPLCVVEAMKMENILKAERDSVVTKINASPGDSLAVDAVIMEFE